MLAPGEIVAGYRVDRVLGRGGMGVVYEATQLSLRRTVALKILAPHLSDDPMFRARFQREGIIQARIDHPHIVSVYEAGETQQGLFLAMRLVRGPTLKDMIVARQLDAGRTFRLLRPIAEAVDHAHAAGLVHRDIKPQNILVAGDHPYLADFGLTKSTGQTSITRSGQFVGTLDYVAPEQISGDAEPSPKTDIYALAGVLYECLTGVVPYPKRSEAAVLYAHLSLPPPRVSEHRPDLPAELDAALVQGMAKDPDGRPTTASELVLRAEQAFTRQLRAVTAVPPPVESPEQLGVRRAESGVSTAETSRPDLETVASPAGLGPGVTRPRGRSQSSRGPRRAALVAGAAALIVVGALVGRAVGGSSDDGGRTGLEAAAGPLTLRIPESWRPPSEQLEIPGLEIEDRLAVEPRDRSGALVAGTIRALGPDVLPTGFASRLARPPRRGVVRLGSHDAFEFGSLAVRRLATPVTLYVVPLASRAGIVACLGRAGSAALRECRQAAASVELRDADAQPVLPSAAYAEAVGRALEELERRRAGAERRLRAVRTPQAQARLVVELSEAYGAASSALDRAPAGPLDRRLHRALVDATRRAADGYRSVGAAAERGDRSAYRDRVRDAQRLELTVARRTRDLERAGYAVE